MLLNVEELLNTQDLTTWIKSNVSISSGGSHTLILVYAYCMFVYIWIYFVRSHFHFLLNFLNLYQRVLTGHLNNKDHGWNQKKKIKIKIKLTVSYFDDGIVIICHHLMDLLLFSVWCHCTFCSFGVLDRTKQNKTSDISLEQVMVVFHFFLTFYSLTINQSKRKSLMKIFASCSHIVHLDPIYQTRADQRRVFHKSNMSLMFGCTAGLGVTS